MTERQIAEQKEAKKVKIYSIAFVVVLVALIVLAAAISVNRSVEANGVHEKNTVAATIGSHELSNAELLSDEPLFYATTREEAFVGNMSQIATVQADGAPVVTFYGVTAEDIDLVYLEDIGDLYVDYDRVKPQIELDYIRTDGADSVSYKLDTAYNFAFTVNTERGSDTILVVSRRSDVQ